jgi:hypothetical protein
MTMSNEKKQAAVAVLKKVGKAVWSAIPWICLWISLSCWFMLPYLYAKGEAELESKIAALEAENTMYESVNDRLEEDVEWMRSLVEQEAADGQTK